jgi:hypothetical protein
VVFALMTGPVTSRCLAERVSPILNAEFMVKVASTAENAERQETCYLIEGFGKPLLVCVAMVHLDASGAAPSRRSWEAKDTLTMREEPRTSRGR